MFINSNDFVNDVLEWIENSDTNPHTRNGYLTALIHYHPELRGTLQYLHDKLEDERKKHVVASRGKADNLPSIKKLLKDVLISDLSPLDKFFVYIHVRFPERWNFWFGPDSLNTLDVGKWEITMNDYKSISSYGVKVIKLNDTAKELYNQLSEADIEKFTHEGKKSYEARVVRAFKKIHPDLGINTIRKKWNEEIRQTKVYKDLDPDDMDKVHETLMSQNMRTGLKYYR